MLAGNVFNNLPGDTANPTFAEIVMKGTLTQAGGPSVLVVNVLHFARLSGIGTDDENDLLGAFNLFSWIGDYLAAITNQLTFDETTVRFMDDVTRPAVSAAGIGVGAVSTDRAPSFVTVGVQKKGYARGRSYRGKMSLAGIVEADTTGNKIGGASGVTTWANIATEMLDMLSFSGTVDTWGLVVISSTLSSLLTNPTLFTGSRASDLVMNAQLGSMLRRKGGRGA